MAVQFALEVIGCRYDDGMILQQRSIVVAFYYCPFSVAVLGEKVLSMVVLLY